MGLFSFLGKQSEKKGRSQTKADRELARLGRIVENKLSQNYDRQEAIEQLSRMATGPAASVLLKRFNWRMDPSITDQEEKEAAARGVAAAGEAALAPLRDYCSTADSLTWPLRILGQIVSEDRMSEELLSLLDQFDTEYVRNAEPKLQLIERLEAYDTEEVRVAVEPFLMDVSEPVRFAAAKTVFALKHEASLEPLVEALCDEESLRVRNRIARGIAEAGWDLPDDSLEAVREALPEAFSLDGRQIRIQQ